MFCVNCGSIIEGEYRFCAECGAPAASAADGGQPPTAPYVHRPSSQSVEHEVVAEQPRREEVSVAFSSGHVLAQWVCVVLGLTLIMDHVFVTAAEFDTNRNLQAVVGAVQFVVSLGAAVLFLVWIYRAHRNLPALDASGLKYSPGWAVGGFFIPIMNLWRPYQVTAEIWKASDPNHVDPDGRAWQKAPVSPLLNFWWALWIVSGIVGSILLRLALQEPESLEMFQVRSLALAASDAIEILAAVLAILVVWQIDARQEEKNRRLQGARSSASRLLST